MDGQELLNYLSNFNSESYRKQALDLIISDQLFKKFLSTPEGNKVTEFFTKRIADDVSNIIQIALAWDSDIQKRTEKIIALGTRTGVVLSALKEMVFQIDQGEQHINAMKKENQS